MKSNKLISKLTLHPTNEELAYFIDKKLSPSERKIIIEHLIYCDECSDKVAIIIKIIKKK